jgi:hypothetical protein
MKPEPDVALLEGVWYDAVGASKLKESRTVDIRPVRVMLAVVARPVPVPAWQ